ncbi:MAG: inositol monophosphatase family protein [Candidatus Curtissbacteria bacterium]|nr:inositol monophosphatase family protein [Candidatus Curtissbacteria bacterium]
MVDIAINAARQAGQLALKYFKSQPKVFYKPDNTPVTRADKEAEQLIRKIIAKNFPDHGIIGEEFEPVNPQARFKWVIDPIDGTKGFIRRIPFWSTLLAVMKNDKPIIGICFFPAINEFYMAQKGKGAFLNNKRIHVSKISKIEDAFISHGGIKSFEKQNKLGGLLRLSQTVQCDRGFGDAFGYALVAQGKIDAFMEGGNKIHDVAAPSILIEEAGGKFTDLSGKFSLTSGSDVATNGLLHRQVLKLLNS